MPFQASRRLPHCHRTALWRVLSEAESHGGSIEFNGDRPGNEPKEHVMFATAPLELVGVPITGAVLFIVVRAVQAIMQSFNDR